MDQLRNNRDRLLGLLERLGSCAVAFSGGVDSAVVACAAFVALGQRALAVTGTSPSLAAGERQAAGLLARKIGIRHVELSTHELDNPAYAANGADRCFHCKTELYSRMQARMIQWDVQHLVNGTNADDLSDHRPGLRAALEYRVVSPLADLGLGKDEVRELARSWQLPVADKPATPCLSSRIAYGEPVTVQRLEQIDRAERWLREQGLCDTRVRWHAGDLVRLEVPLADLPRLCVEPLRSQLVEHLRQLGCQLVTLDLQGRRSGSLNSLLPLDELERAARAIRPDVVD
jgi:uncharacterized protein